MMLGRVERYTIHEESEGVVIRMRQGRSALGAAVPLGLLGLMLWTIKPGDFAALQWAAWCLEGFAAMLVVVFLVGAFYCEEVCVTPTQLRWGSSFQRSPRRMPLGGPLRLRVSIEPKGDAFTHGPVLGCHVAVLLPIEGPGLEFLFQTSQHMDEFLHIIGMALPLEVDDPRTKQRV